MDAATEQDKFKACFWFKNGLFVGYMGRADPRL